MGLGPLEFLKDPDPASGPEICSFEQFWAVFDGHGNKRPLSSADGENLIPNGFLRGLALVGLILGAIGQGGRERG